MIISTDPAHSLGDSLDLELGQSATQVRQNLWAHEVSALHETERHWQKLHDYATKVFATQGLDDVVDEEVANPPGMDEVASLMWIKHYAERDEHDLLVVDCAPTGETLQLLMFPDAARWWLEKIFPWQRRAMKVARPMLRRMVDVPLPSDEVMASLQDLVLDIEGMKKVLTDTSVTSIRLVLNLEKMVIKEAKRAFTYLSLFGYVTDAVIVNRRLPAQISDPLLRSWSDIQKRYQQEVEQSFQPLPIFQVPLFEEEVVGERMLRKMGQAIYGSADPRQKFYDGSSQRMQKDGSEYILALKVPFADREAIELSRQDGELFVTLGNYRRDISLPRVLASRRTLGAKIEEGELRIRFGK